MDAVLRGIRAVAGRAGVTIQRKRDDVRTDLYRSSFGPETLAKKPFINIGAGSFWHPYWTNVDYVSKWYGDVQRDVVHYDIMGKEPLPFADASIKIAYTSHTIEHVKDEAVAFLFGEVRRVLEPGGIFRVTTGPDADTDYRALLADDSDWFYWDAEYTSPGAYGHIYYAPPASMPLAERWLHDVASQLAPNSKSPSPRKYRAPEIMEIVNSRSMAEALDFFTGQCTFQPDWPGNHVSWWSHDKVMRYLKKAGFNTVYRSGYRQSVSPFLRQSDLFDSTHPQCSLYVEAVRQ